MSLIRKWMAMHWSFKKLRGVHVKLYNCAPTGVDMHAFNQAFSTSAPLTFWARKFALEDCPMHCGMFSNIPGLAPLAGTAPSWKQKFSILGQLCPSGWEALPSVKCQLGFKCICFGEASRDGGQTKTHTDYIGLSGSIIYKALSRGQEVC